jgi:hypothetical protein
VPRSTPSQGEAESRLDRLRCSASSPVSTVSCSQHEIRGIKFPWRGPKANGSPSYNRHSFSLVECLTISLEAPTDLSMLHQKRSGLMGPFNTDFAKQGVRLMAQKPWRSQRWPGNHSREPLGSARLDQSSPLRGSPTWPLQVLHRASSLEGSLSFCLDRVKGIWAPNTASVFVRLNDRISLFIVVR